MSAEECAAAMAAGAAAVRACAAAHDGEASQVVACIGELGIGNTTAAAALLAALTGAAPGEVCGRGTGE